MKLVYFRRGVLPVAHKVIMVESQGWVNEAINTVAIPLTFFLAFGLGLSRYMENIEGVSYMAFLTPGLITMTILLEAFRTGAWGLWMDRWHQNTLDEYRIAPIRTSDIILGEILGGFTVALIKGTIVAAILLLFTPVHILWGSLPLYFAAIVFPGCIFFTCLGAMVGTNFPKPDNIAQSQTIFITPLLYLGGLFFPLSALPAALRPWLTWLPTTAAFEGGRNLLLKGEFQLHYVAVMYLTAILCFAFATWLFQEKLSE